MAALLRTSLALVLVCRLAQAQLTPIAPFAGAHSEDFEAQSGQLNVVCIQERVFADRADLCCAFGNGCSIVDVASSAAMSTPKSGAQMFHADVVVTLTFDRPVRRFGGWFASDWVDAGTASFVDTSGQTFAYQPFQMTPCTAGCAWTWNGWDVGSGPPITAIWLDTATATGGHFELEDLELDFADGFASTYCTAKTNSQGCTPAISATGAASATSGSGFVIDAASVLNQHLGLLFYGKTGPASAPFHGGWLCATPPRRRTPVQSSGGSIGGSDCTGTYSLDFNSWIASGIDPALITGAQVNAQYWSRDPGFAPPDNVGLTDAVEFQLAP